MDEYDVLLALHGLEIVLILLGIYIIIWRIKVSLKAELTTAVDAIVQKLADAEKNSTPDSDIQPQIDKLNAAVNPPAPQQ